MKTVTFFLPVTAQQKQVNCLNKCIITSSTELSGFIISLHPCTAAWLSVQLQCLLWIMTLLWDFNITRKSAAFHLFSSRNLLGFNLKRSLKRERILSCCIFQQLHMYYSNDHGWAKQIPRRKPKHKPWLLKSLWERSAFATNQDCGWTSGDYTFHH